VVEIGAHEKPKAPRLWNLQAYASLKRVVLQSPVTTLFTVLAVLAVLAMLPSLVDWAYTRAVFSPDHEACANARGIGACWGVVVQKYPLILWGRYPFEEQWRAKFACALLIFLLLYCARPGAWGLRLLPIVLIALWIIFTLMSGALGPLEFLRGTLIKPLLGTALKPVPTELWGGLPLTLLLSFVCIFLATPLALVLALARMSRLPLFSVLSTFYIELIRGVPLISVLFMASYMFPLLLPAAYSPDVLIRVICGISLFAAAYLAEIFRAGIQAVPKGQLEASASLGLTPGQTKRYVVLPQAIKIVIPSMMNSFIAIFKDTSLITIVSLYELTGSLSLAMNGDALWRPFKLEGYLFITLIYFLFCFVLSRYSLLVEKRLSYS